MWLLLAWLQLQVPLGLDALLPAPPDNPITAEKAALGKRLFFDKNLSRDRTIACATCHLPERAFTDGKPLAVGIRGKTGTRRTPALLNRAYGRSFFWDGREPTLEMQVLKPIVNPLEMDLNIEEALSRLHITERDLTHALATYVRTILSGDSPYDRFVAGDRTALSADALAGLALFRGKANCSVCHLGPNLTDERLHNTGIGKEHPGAFKTPTLREVAIRPPYMHDGSLATLADVIEHYDKGGTPSPNLDPEIQKLALKELEKLQLQAFLRALSGRVTDGFTPAR